LTDDMQNNYAETTRVQSLIPLWKISKALATWPAFYAMLSITLNTPATAPWKSAALTIVMLVAGFVLSLEPEKKTEHIVEKSGDW